HFVLPRCRCEPFTKHLWAGSCEPEILSCSGQDGRVRLDPGKRACRICVQSRGYRAEPVWRRIMRRGRAIFGVGVALSLLLGFEGLLPRSPVDLKRRKLASREIELARLSSPVDLRRNGELLIAGRALRCGRVRNVLDPSLPNLGSAAPGVVVLNPY